MLKFRDLKIGQRFEFLHPLPHNSEHGPWIKRSARTYYKNTSPFCVESILEHQFWYDHYNEVGTINVPVELAGKENKDA